MSIKNSIKILLISLLIVSCESDYKFNLKTPKKLKVNKILSIHLSEKNNSPIDSVQFSIDKKVIKTNSGFSVNLDISDYKLGRHIVTAIIFYAKKTKRMTKIVIFLANEAPKLYDYKIINTYPHDKKAYTQGLEIHNGYMYESTGQKGESTLRKVELKTGKVVQQIDIDNQYFGEGITRLGNEIFMLTWKKGIGFVYDAETFKQKKTFKYKNSLEGWGLANNGKKLIKSDGTERIWFLNAKSQAEERFIEAYTDKRKVQSLNELEYINGKIYANIYQQNSILIINEQSGKIEGIAILDGLQKEIEKTQKLTDPKNEVLNGIAYDKTTKKLYVTGKNWGKLFEIELIERK